MIEPQDMVKPLDIQEIGKCRDELGLTQEQLAKALGTTLTTVWRWESQRTHPNLPVPVAFTLRSLVRYKHEKHMTAEEMAEYITSGFRTFATV